MALLFILPDLIGFLYYLFCGLGWLAKGCFVLARWVGRGLRRGWSLLVERVRGRGRELPTAIVVRRAPADPGLTRA